jgi:hypothetical protein
LKSIFRPNRLAMTLMSLGLLAACGGGGGNGMTPRVISGAVIDGYIEGATVCLDVNSNLICDPGEPSSTTDKNGSYSLSYSGSIDGLLVLAVVPEGAIDSELGEVKQAFDLMSPAENALTVTPITTLVASDMATRKVSVEDAVNAVQAQFNFQKPLLDYDFKKAGDTETLKVAQVIAASMAYAKQEFAELNKNGNLGLNAAEMIKAVNNDVKTNVLPQLILSDGTSAIKEAFTKQENLVTAIAVKSAEENPLSGRIQQIVAQSKAGDGSVTKMSDAFKEGIVIGELDSGDYIDANGNRVGRWSGFTNKLSIEFIKYDPATDKEISITEKVWTTDSGVTDWYKVFSNDEFEVNYTFAGTEWISRIGNDLQGKPVFQDNCLVLPVKAGSDVGTKVCAVSKNLTGKKVSEFLKDEDGKSSVCKTPNGSDVANCDPNQVFPPNSIAYDLSLSSNTNLYEAWTGSEDWDGYDFKGKDWNKPGSVMPTITAFVEREWTYPQWVGSNCSTGFLVKDFIKNNEGKIASGTMKWGKNTSGSGCNNGSVNTYTEETKFIIENVGGKEIMRLPYPNIYRQSHPGNSSASQLIFGVFEKELHYSLDSNGNRNWSNSQHDLKKTISGIYSGEYTPKGATQTIVFDGNIFGAMQVGNKVLLNTMLKASGIKDFPN